MQILCFARNDKRAGKALVFTGSCVQRLLGSSPLSNIRKTLIHANAIAHPPTTSLG